jgi:hypothetical protein
VGRWKISERTLSESTFWPNWNPSEWNLSEGIFQKIFSVKPESFRKKSFRTNLSEIFLAQPESFRMESF